MKLHLPKLLLTAVMAAVAYSSYALAAVEGPGTYASGTLQELTANSSHTLTAQEDTVWDASNLGAQGVSFDINAKDYHVKLLAPVNSNDRDISLNSVDSASLWLASGCWVTDATADLENAGTIYLGGAQLQITQAVGLKNNFVLGASTTKTQDAFTSLNNTALRVGHWQHSGQTSTLSGEIDVRENTRISFQNSNHLKLTGTLKGSGEVTLTSYNGNNTLIISGTTTNFTGVVSQGQVQNGSISLKLGKDAVQLGGLQGGLAVGLAEGTQSSILTLNVAAGKNVSYSGTLAAGISIIKSGEGTQTFTNALTLNGNVTTNGGVLNLNGVLSINAGSTVSISGTTTTNIDKVISNAGSLSLGNVKFNLGNATSEVVGSLDDTVTGTQSYTEKYTFITGSGTVTKVGDFTFSKNGATYVGTLADDNKSVQTSSTRYNIAVDGTADASTALQATVEGVAVSRVNVLGTMTGVYDGAWASKNSAVQVTGNGTVQVTGKLEDHNAKFAGFTGTILVDGNDPNTANGDEPNGGRIHLGTARDAFSNSTIVLTGAVINGTAPVSGYITGWHDNANDTFKQNIVLKGGAIRADKNSRWKTVTVDNVEGATNTTSYFIVVNEGTGLTGGTLNLNGGTLKFLGDNYSVRLGGNVKFDGGVLDLNNLTVESNTKIANLQIVRGSTGEIKNGSLYVQNFDMRGSDANPYGGTLTLTNANIMLDTNWSSGNGAKVLLEGSSSFTHAGAKISSTTESGQASIVSQADLNPQSFVSSEGVTITNATVTANNADMTISAKLKDSSVTNASTGSLTVADMTVTDASAKQSTLTGDMTVTKLTLASGLSETVAAVTTSGALTLGSITLDLTDYAAGNYTLVSATGDDGSISWDSDAVNAWSYTGLREGLEANVDFGSDNKTLQLTISEMVTPSESLITATVVEKNEGGSFVYGLEGTTLTLTVKSDFSLDSLAADGMVTVDLISEGMMNAILADLTNSETGEVTKLVTLKLTDGTTTIAADAFNKVVFVNEKGEGYYGEMVGGQLLYNVERIPEPTTATLSLLALMGLAARRRRQK